MKFTTFDLGGHKQGTSSNHAQGMWFLALTVQVLLDRLLYMYKINGKQQR